MKIVDLTIKASTAPKMKPLSINDILFDGAPFPWATMGPTKIEMSRNDMATITVTIPFWLRPEQQAEEHLPHVHVFAATPDAVCIVTGCTVKATDGPFVRDEA